VNQVQHRLLTRFGTDETGFLGNVATAARPPDALWALKTGRDERIRTSDPHTPSVKAGQYVCLFSDTILL
jgi:hypothetical protein